MNNKENKELDEQAPKENVWNAKVEINWLKLFVEVISITIIILLIIFLISFCFPLAFVILLLFGALKGTS